MGCKGVFVTRTRFRDEQISLVIVPILIILIVPFSVLRGIKNYLCFLFFNEIPVDNNIAPDETPDSAAIQFALFSNIVGQTLKLSTSIMCVSFHANRSKLNFIHKEWDF